MKITQKSCPTCGETLTMEILNEGLHVNWVCPNHGIVMGSISSQKYGILDRLWPIAPYFYGAVASVYSIYSILRNNPVLMVFSLVWASLMVFIISSIKGGARSQ